MQWYVDQNILSCCNTLIMRGTEVLDFENFGYMDLTTRAPLREDAIYRMYSSTKLITSVAAMILFERGHFKLDDPIANYLPKFAEPRVLKADAESVADVVPAESPILVKQVLSHSAGLSYGFIEPESVVDKCYQQAGIGLQLNQQSTLEELCEKLADLPLVYQPGSYWRYSFATDVTARLVEVWSGQRFDDFLKAEIFRPLSMVDTDFYVPPEKLDRLVTMYAPTNLLKPMKGGLVEADTPEQSQYAKPATFFSGGGGLVSTVSDYLEFVRMLVNEGEWNGARILQPETLRLMRTNQLAENVHVNFPMWAMPGTVFGLGFAVKEEPNEKEHPTAKDEYHWGGMAGTHAWMAPRANLTGLCMTQRMPGFWHPFSHDFKRLAYVASTQW
ncbi:MAG: serine hydrolase [Gammaproteobacteria bacterium]|nr:serine hydrolase [Gammaproteobacteria bacterium]